MSSRMSRREKQDLRRRGFRPVTIWVPDPTAPGFKEEARRQALALSQSPNAEEDQRFIDAISIDATTEP